MDRCEQCGFVYDEVAVADVPSRLRRCEALYRAELGPGPGAAGGGEEDWRRRAHPDVWSALEYACHVRDVLLVQRERTVLALVEDNPGFARMYRDERVVLAGYAAHAPAQVADQLGMAAELCATVFERLSPEQWARPLIYNFPAPSRRDVAWLARNTVHEVEHHLSDLRSVLARVTTAAVATAAVATAAVTAAPVTTAPVTTDRDPGP